LGGIFGDRGSRSQGGWVYSGRSLPGQGKPGWRWATGLASMTRCGTQTTLQPEACPGFPDRFAHSSDPSHPKSYRVKAFQAHPRAEFLPQRPPFDPSALLRAGSAQDTAWAAPWPLATGRARGGADAIRPLGHGHQLGGWGRSAFHSVREESCQGLSAASA